MKAVEDTDLVLTNAHGVNAGNVMQASQVHKSSHLTSATSCASKMNINGLADDLLRMVFSFLVGDAPREFPATEKRSETLSDKSTNQYTNSVYYRKYFNVLVKVEDVADAQQTITPVCQRWRRLFQSPENLEMLTGHLLQVSRWWANSNGNRCLPTLSYGALQIGLDPNDNVKEMSFASVKAMILNTQRLGNTVKALALFQNKGCDSHASAYTWNFFAQHCRKLEYLRLGITPFKQKQQMGTNVRATMNLRSSSRAILRGPPRQCTILSMCKLRHLEVDLDYAGKTSDVGDSSDRINPHVLQEALLHMPNLESLTVTTKVVRDVARHDPPLSIESKTLTSIVAKNVHRLTVNCPALRTFVYQRVVPSTGALVFTDNHDVCLLPVVQSHRAFEDLKSCFVQHAHHDQDQGQQQGWLKVATHGDNVPFLGLDRVHDQCKVMISNFRALYDKGYDHYVGMLQREQTRRNHYLP